MSERNSAEASGTSTCLTIKVCVTASHKGYLSVAMVRGRKQWHLGKTGEMALDLLDHLVAMYRAGAEGSGWRCFATCGGEMIPPGRAIFGLGGAVSALRNSVPTRSDEGPYR